MPSANVELVRRTFQAFGRGDFEPAFAAFADDIAWRTCDDEPDQQVHRGVPALRRFVEHLADPWKDRFGPAIEWEEFVDCGDWVVAPWHGKVHGHGSGIEIEISETYAVLVRDGKIARVEEYRTPADALEAVGPPK